MAAANPNTLFHQAVSKILSSWSALQIAVQHGFGGANSKQKEQDLVNNIEEIFRRNGNIDPYDFADFLEDELDDKFDLLFEDGSLQMISNHICQSFILLRDGRTAEVGSFLEKLPNAAQGGAPAQFAGEDDSSDEDSDDADPPPQQSLQNGQDSCNGAGTSDETMAAGGAGDSAMDVEEEADGWTVVKTGKKKSSKR